MSKSTPSSPLTDAQIAAISLQNLQSVVAIDSQSDENSDTIPSTPGQQELASFVATYFQGLGAEVTRDDFANVIARFPGRGQGEDAPPIALMIHLDTARGTSNPDTLTVTPTWDGQRVPYTANPRLDVSTDTYPDLQAFVGHDIVHGDGLRPFGLDDKLGLTHLMTLAQLLADDPSHDHPPLLLIGRPDEEIGRMEAVEGLATYLASLGIRSGFTVDGILPYEVNMQNFNAAAAELTFTGVPLSEQTLAAYPHAFSVTLGGVNAHGATAHAEGGRSATRFAAALYAELSDSILPVAIQPDPLRDCDATLIILTNEPDRLKAAIDAAVSPHVGRGASFEISPTEPPQRATDALIQALTFIPQLINAEVAQDRPAWAEDSHGWAGYSHPYRATLTQGHLSLDIRIRDFDPALLEARKSQIATLAKAAHIPAKIWDQYINMGPKLESRRDLLEHALVAGEKLGLACVEQPIRGGTGVDPFLDAGVAIANLGTGYFAPESEKELTSLTFMAGHVRWLLQLLKELSSVR